MGASPAWRMPPILLTVVVQLFGLMLINDRVMRAARRMEKRRGLITRFAVIMAVAALLATALHGLEAVGWAEAFRLLGAVPDNKSAILYSLNCAICSTSGMRP